MQLFNSLENFEVIIENIRRDFKPSSYKSGLGTSVGGLFGIILGYCLDDVAIAAMGLSFTSPLVIVGGLVTVFVGACIIVSKIYNNKKKNSKKVDDYFEKIFKQIKVLKDNQIKLLKQQKDKYFEELDKLIIEKEDVKYLKKMQFIDKMKMIIDYYS